MHFVLCVLIPDVEKKLSFYTILIATIHQLLSHMPTLLYTVGICVCTSMSKTEKHQPHSSEFALQL